jgi:hypothetical protein
VCDCLFCKEPGPARCAFCKAYCPFSENRFEDRWLAVLRWKAHRYYAFVEEEGGVPELYAAEARHGRLREAVDLLEEARLLDARFRSMFPYPYKREDS